jgi:thioredoxin-dependent peroxiredoxin
MSLSIGSKAPAFELPSTNGSILSTKNDLAGKSFVLFFYPKNDTRVCTAEVCEFRDQFAAFRDLNIPVFGISRDSIQSHKRFKAAHQLPFDLLSDLSGKVAKDYDALLPIIKMPKRVTYLIDTDGKIAEVFSDMFESKGHISAMLTKLPK